MIAQYKRFIAEQFETTWEHLQTGAAYDHAGAELLLFYDESDRFVPHDEGDKLQEHCLGSTLIKTNGYSHLKLLTAPELHAAVARFIASKPR